MYEKPKITANYARCHYMTVELIENSCNKRCEVIVMAELGGKAIRINYTFE